MPDSPHSGRNRSEKGKIDSEVSPVRSLTFDTEEDAYVAEFDDSDGSPSAAAVSVVAEITGQSATALRPLHHVVDPEALDRIVGHRPSGPFRNERLVEFTYEALTIRLSSSGVMKVHLPRSGGPDDSNERL